MNILVLSPSKKFKKDKTEYSAEVLNALQADGNEVKLREFFAPLKEIELRKSVKSEPKPDLIVITDLIDGNDDDFRSEFAFVISRGE